MDFPTIEDCVKFHGHCCGGIALGYVLSRYAMEQIGAKPGDHLFCVAEFQNCMTDSVQCVTGCTAGKGNLVVKNYGKRALTLVKSDTGEGVRVHMTYEYDPNVPRDKSAELIMAMDPASMCKVVSVKLDVPQKNQHSYMICEECKEEFAQFCGVQVGDKFCCPECAAKLQ